MTTSDKAAITQRGTHSSLEKRFVRPSDHCADRHPRGHNSYRGESSVGERRIPIRQIAFSVAAIASVAVVASVATTSGRAEEEAAPIYGVKVPAGYRDWKLIAMDHLVIGKVDQLRAQFGNEIAIKTFKEGKVPFPDGTIIAAQHWT